MKRRKKEIKKEVLVKNCTIFLALICLGLIFLSNGYAVITDLHLSLNGTAVAMAQNTVAISSVQYVSDNNADTTNSQINNFYGTMMDSSICLNNDKDSTITYRVTVINLTNRAKKYVETTHDLLFYDNTDITYEVSGIDTNTTIEQGESTSFNITFKYAEEKQNYTDTTLNSYINFVFDNVSDNLEEITYLGNCVFRGQNQDIIGSCAGGRHVDYLDTGISLFNQQYYHKDFEIGFTVNNIDNSRFRSGKVDTVFNCLYDSSPFPGITFRIENSKWYLQVGNGISNKKLSFDKGSIQKFKLYKRDNLVYYEINDGSPVYVTDLTNLALNFNSTCTFGTALNPDGTPRPERFLVADLSDVYLKVTEPENEPPEPTYDDMDEMILAFVNETMTTAFESSSAHTFDGTSSSVVPTNVPLFSTTNYQKSFIVTLEIDDFDITHQTFTQATLFNAKNEGSNKYPGLVLRKNSNKLELGFKNGEGQTLTSTTIPPTAKRINIIKKGMGLYYQYDFEDIKTLGTISSFPVGNCFNVQSTFGSNINGSGSYDRILVGTLSHMKIQIGSN